MRALQYRAIAIVKHADDVPARAFEQNLELQRFVIWCIEYKKDEEKAAFANLGILQEDSDSELKA